MGRRSGKGWGASAWKLRQQPLESSAGATEIGVRRRRGRIGLDRAYCAQRGRSERLFNVVGVFTKQKKTRCWGSREDSDVPQGSGAGEGMVVVGGQYDYVNF